MRGWLFVAGIVGALGIAMAAVGAHGPALAGPAARNFAAANAIHMWHALALVGVAALVRDEPPEKMRGKLLAAAGILFAGGTLLFSGTLYVEALIGMTPLPFAAPAGGLALIAGWLTLAAAACT